MTPNAPAGAYVTATHSRRIPVRAVRPIRSRSSQLGPAASGGLGSLVEKLSRPHIALVLSRVPYPS